MSVALDAVKAKLNPELVLSPDNLTPLFDPELLDDGTILADHFATIPVIEGPTSKYVPIYDHQTNPDYKLPVLPYAHKIFPEIAVAILHRTIGTQLPTRLLTVFGGNVDHGPIAGFLMERRRKTRIPIIALIIANNDDREAYIKPMPRFSSRNVVAGLAWAAYKSSIQKSNNI